MLISEGRLNRLEYRSKELTKARARILELETFVVAEGDAHYSHREFEKMEAERESWQKVAASVTADVKMLYEAAKDFHENWLSDAFGEITHEELGKALAAVKEQP